MESIIENITHNKINEIYLLKACKVHLFHSIQAKPNPFQPWNLQFFNFFFKFFFSKSLDIR